MAYESLLLFAGTAFDMSSKYQGYSADVATANLANQQALAQRQAAIVQSGYERQLAVNRYLYINTEDSLDLAKHNIDKNMLNQKIRRERAKFAAQSVARGNILGTPKEAGGSFAAGDRNIEFFGLQALLAKDVNREKRINDFAQRRTNVQLEFTSKVNKLFSDLSAGMQVPDATGLVTGLGASVVKGLSIAENVGSGDEKGLFG
jgi:hypothetical protein